jgi:RHS repeat-associated protein
LGKNGEYTPYGESWVDDGTNKNITGYRFTSKVLDTETGLYYFGARYLVPQTSQWISPDPAIGDYFPVPPTGEHANKYNRSLPGQGGVFNPTNLAIYHYAGNNPIKYVDPDGEADILSRDLLPSRGYKLGNALNFDHWLVTFDNPDGTRTISHYRGAGSGITGKETGGLTYTVHFSGMDDDLMEKAVESATNLERFGGGDNKKARQLYQILKNDCKDYTNAVFGEYKKLWIERQKEGYEKEGAAFAGVRSWLDWGKHKREISSESGKQETYVDLHKNQKADLDGNE